MAVPARLYLDTARLGLMSPNAQLAAGDFVRLASEGAFTLYFDRFLSAGAKCWPDGWLTKYSGLARWPGVAGLKASLRAKAGIDADLPVLLASRSAWLMQYSARLLFHKCERVLVSDCDWPAYREILLREQRRASRNLAIVRLRDEILSGAIDEEEVIRRVCSTYRDHRCDGLFLTAVSNLGIRLPISRIVRAIEDDHRLRFVVVDGAQEFAHAPIALADGYCDLYLTGCHKWLRAHQPMGIAFCGRQRSRQLIERSILRMCSGTASVDPLLRFSSHVEFESFSTMAETVNIGPLFSCHGAILDLPSHCKQIAEHRKQLKNVDTLSQSSMSAGWQALLPHRDFRSGILLVRAVRHAIRKMLPSAVSQLFQVRGIAITAYDDGVIRLSVPRHIWQDDEYHWLCTALQDAV